MKKYHHALYICAIFIAFILGFLLQNNSELKADAEQKAISAKSPATLNVAVVNLQKILSQSTKIKAIRDENTKKLKELSDWLDEVKKEIDAEKNKEKSKKLAEQYKKLAKEKEAFIKQEYDKKIKDVDEELTNLIKNVAQQAGYSTVLINTSVVTGGKDITNDIIKEITR